MSRYNQGCYNIQFWVGIFVAQNNQDIPNRRTYIKPMFSIRNMLNESYTISTLCANKLTALLTKDTKFQRRVLKPQVILFLIF